MPNTLPQLHIQPPTGWLNDPNGIIRLHDRWHVFYQANPHQPVHRDIVWGHASSTDLVRWQHHPTAFAPTPGGPDSGGCWSGVHLPWSRRPAVAYSGVVAGEPSSTVCVREALDPELIRWSEPQVVARTPDGVREMRDPFCFTWGGRHLAIVGGRLSDGDAAVLLYDVADPDSWRYLGVLLRGADLEFDAPHAEIWECPQLLIDGDRCWLIVSRWVENVTLDVLVFDGRISDRNGTPALTVDNVERLDDGEPFYAPQVALDAAGAPLLFGWIREFDDHAAAASGISGCLTLPRRVDTSGGRLRMTVDAGLQEYADGSAAIPLGLGAGRSTQLPPQARVRGAAPAIRLQGDRQDVEIPCPAGDFELWTDGEVVEVFPTGAPTVTLRDSGTEHWRITTDAATTLSVCEVAPPPTPEAPTGTAAESVSTTA
ncbi:MAG TPA: glycoside hydrolase family 32 protein [Flexivirga sp.]|uniref:glycoside hydrolase family 32 protein n=1 Tax=Flexivirga sp. TaxID=1962927 RepID=UPI002BBD354C|nr:glycoside hydrolase family 32 protein [Flexivirga sp.]HWC24388.1 glycoside hydrolase family 32 protein [Flexivirga sp.]